MFEFLSNLLEADRNWFMHIRP